VYNYILSFKFGTNKVRREKNQQDATIRCLLLTSISCCIRCGPDEEHILDVVTREDGARNSG